MFKYTAGDWKITGLNLSALGVAWIRKLKTHVECTINSKSQYAPMCVNVFEVRRFRVFVKSKRKSVNVYATWALSLWVQLIPNEHRFYLIIFIGRSSLLTNGKTAGQKKKKKTPNECPSVFGCMSLPFHSSKAKISSINPA